MTAITSDMRIVCTSEAAPKPRRMSGLGIDFSPVRTPPGAERSRNYFWQEVCYGTLTSTNIGINSLLILCIIITGPLSLSPFGN